MELEWVKDPTSSDIDLYADGEFVGWVEGDYLSGYGVHIVRSLADGVVPDCVERDYVSLRKAMRALEETVTVLLIGRGYGA